jgi:hypothetical protein
MTKLGIRFAAIVFSLIGLLAMGCTQSPPPADGNPTATPSGDVHASVVLTPSHVGRRVRAVLKPGTQVVTGTVVEVDSSRDVAMVETEDQHRISIVNSQISILEVMPLDDPHAHMHMNRRDPAAPPPTRLTFAPNDPNAGGALQTGKVGFLFVDFTKTHRCADPKNGCLLDLAVPLQKAPSTILFVDGASDAVLHVTIPENEDASLLPFSWHVHVLAGPIEGKPEEVKDLLLTQNSDGDILIKSKDLQGARQLILVGTPYKVKQKAIGINAIAPPRMISIDLVEAEKAVGILENNPAIVHSFDTATGHLYTASGSANDSEMILSIIDPTRKSPEALPETRFSVQDGILFPAWTLDVKDAAGKHWQRIGAYPIPPFLSHETPDATRITVEIGKEKKGEFPAPAVASVRAPESVLVKADLDIHYAGLQDGHTYKMIVAHGVPNAKDKTKLFNPTASDVKSDKPYEGLVFDVSADVSDDSWPVQGFVWFQLSTPWKRTGGFMAGATPLRAPETKMAPTRRLAFYPASSPGLRFITFNGPKLSATNASAGVPAALSSRGMGGLTLGTGGPYVPFSPAVGSSSIQDNGSAARRPIAMSGASAQLQSGPIKISVSANSSSGATAIAICEGGGCSASTTNKGDMPKPGDKPMVPSVDKFAPAPSPTSPDSVGTLSSGGTSYPGFGGD